METNPRLELAFDYLEYTGTSVFLTGKAGTGKTTFLQELKRRSPKRMIVVAPTGVAAINAGGVTIHSFFQLPFGPYVAQTTEASNEGNRFTHKFNREKINIIRSMDLLVIDEISMVRADLLDAINDMLCRYRDRDKPFGGVQLLMIGDLQQLSPVVKEEEWGLLRGYYASPFFFSSRALQNLPYISIELTKVYRQTDDLFVRLLNKIRDNQADEETLRLLNRRYIPGFNPDDSEGYITLTTHNYQAQQINKRKLDEIEERAYTYTAEIKDDFPDYSFPTDQHLTLKKGAQVMFIKNDSSPEKRYYNGKIGRITAINFDHITVKCGEEEAITVTREEWTNTKYSIDNATWEISETIVGIFKQYPLKTAWAITIHKSQGLTFEKAIVDAASAFTHGQVYVALSRCKTLEGLVLGSPLRQEALINDRTVKNFTAQIEQQQPDRSQLTEARQAYFLQLLEELCDFNPIFKRLQYTTHLFSEHLWKLYPDLTTRFKTTRETFFKALVKVGRHFIEKDIETRMVQCPGYEQDEWLQTRIIKAVGYFTQQINTLLLPLLEDTHPEIDNKETRKTIEESLKRLHQETDIKLAILEAVSSGFDVPTYLLAKAKAMIEKPKPKTVKSTIKTEISGDILHPKLYNTLRLWRKEEAIRLNLPAYTILQQKALLGVANALPTNKKELLAIPGIGKKIIEHYGIKLLEFVDQYRLGINENKSD